MSDAYDVDQNVQNLVKAVDSLVRNTAGNIPYTGGAILDTYDRSQGGDGSDGSDGSGGGDGGGVIDEQGNL